MAFFNRPMGILNKSFSAVAGEDTRYLNAWQNVRANSILVLLISLAATGNVIASNSALPQNSAQKIDTINMAASEQIIRTVGSFSIIVSPNEIKRSVENVPSSKPVVKVAANEWKTITGAASAADLKFYCKATIAVLFGRPISIMHEYKTEPGISYIEYVRQDDNSRWRNRCTFIESRIVWGAEELNGPGTSPGRWRTHDMDDVITLETNGGQLKVVLESFTGSQTVQTFPIE